MATDLMSKKLEYWEHKLLDLGKRNRMLNYRETKRTTLRLTEPSYEELFKRIAVNEETLTFQRTVDRETDVRVFSVLSLMESLSVPLPVTVGDIKGETSALERQKTLKNLRSKSKLAQEEQGINILYLSFGFIEWRDGKGASASQFTSPLVLVPVTLSLEALNMPYSLKKHEDDIVVNPTLEYYFKSEYGIQLPQFDADKDDLEEYFKKLEEIADQRGWRIRREVSLGLLSFMKITMYNDLLKNEERIRSNPVIRAMAGDAEEVNDIPEQLVDYDLDSVNPMDCYQVMSADSSQQDAILYSKNNISFVMQGPPGAGKSQTITNIIAEALADGKKVLFVSEKMAALQVVYRRLQEAYLGDFCLPLHSYKANKKEIVNQIGETLKLKQTRVKDSAINSLEELMAVRQELNRYADELHTLNPELNLSCYEVYSRLEEVNDAPAIIFDFADPLTLSHAGLQAVLSALKEYSFAVERLGSSLKDNPWEGFSARTTGYEYTEKIKNELTGSIACLSELNKALNKLAEIPELSGRVSFGCIPELIGFIEKVTALPEIPKRWTEEFSFEEGIAVAEEAKALFSELDELKSATSTVFLDSVREYDCNGWRNELLKKADSVISLPMLDVPSAEMLVNEAGPLRRCLANVSRYLSEVKSALSETDRILCTDFAENIYRHSAVAALVDIICSNIVVNRAWLSYDLSAIRQSVLELQTVSAEAEAIKYEILQDWEDEILDIEYASILTRYRTDYAGMFKAINLQYRTDRRLIQSYSRAMIRSLSDEMAVDVLKKIKAYHDRVKWVYSRAGELSGWLGYYYNGVNTDWNAILSALDACKKLKDLFGGRISVYMLDIMSEEHTDKAEQIDILFSKVTLALSRAKNEIINSPFEFNLSLSEFDFDDTLSVLDSYISALDGILSYTENLQEHLVNEDESAASVYRAAGLLEQLYKAETRLSLLSNGYEEFFEHLYSGFSTDWDRIISLLNTVSELKNEDRFGVFGAIVNCSDGTGSHFNAEINIIKDAFGAAETSLQWIKQQFSPDTVLTEKTVYSLLRKLDGCLDNLPGMENWIDYQEAKYVCCEAGAEDFIVKFEENYIGENIEKTFLKGFYHMWLGAVCDKAASVRRFRKNVQEERVRRFIELDDLQLLIAQMRIREKLIENLPSVHRMLKATDEVAILNKELGKKRNIMPLRKLFRKIPNLLMKLKPCLMMSPLSVSYFLETEAYHFDLVIFDEASQIFPEDAIGAIFRGSQVIIVGDSKQLPPTNFFASATNNFENEYDAEDEEDLCDVVSDSILEEAAAVLPNRTLLWHYRSKSESLIAFSNREIYGNSLITFPDSSVDIPDMGVEYIYVEDGVYDRGGKKNNLREAEECVKIVFEHIEKHPDRSLGIIAFSESQQATIENAIIDYRERNPEYEWFFDESGEEPFFIKNLENVQGDERDTIIFSICYGKDKDGIMHMNFGPVGHNGGERRLNVAVTRAKCNIKVVGSVKPSDIDANRAKSEGARMLRSYIEYAINGPSALTPAESTDSIETEDDFCDTVAEFLEQQGYLIEKRVGCSDYKIDIAVKNPGREGEYLAGIECDGLSYIRAKTARDRDHLRKSVLQNMGWNLYRVWSTEWSRNSQAEKQALLEFLFSLYDADGNVSHVMKESNSALSGEDVESVATETQKDYEEPATDNLYGFDFYEEALWWEAEYSESNDNSVRISENILHIVAVEQPIHMEMLYKRMGPSFTTGKATENVKSTINRVISQLLRGRVYVDEENFAWLLPLSPVNVRIPKEGSIPRPVEYIHTQEFAAAMMKIIESSFGITEEALASECARVFGFERKGPKIKAKTDAAIKWLADNGIIRIIDGKAQITGG